MYLANSFILERIIAFSLFVVFLIRCDDDFPPFILLPHASFILVSCLQVVVLSSWFLSKKLYFYAFLAKVASSAWLRFFIFIQLYFLLPKEFYGLKTTACTANFFSFFFRRERDNADAERAQHIKQIHDLQEHIQEKERQFVELQEQVSLLFW